jgi:hypothetical protein
LDHPLPWLRYLEADELADQVVDFDEMDVESPTGDRLGEVEGFVVDSVSGRPYYIAVDSGGWFKSKLFLLPVGYARLDRAREVIVAELTRDRVEKFPGFDKDAFQKFGKEELGRFNEETCRVCNISGVVYTYSETEPWSAAWDRPDFRHPDWWPSMQVQPGRTAASVTPGPRAASPGPDRPGRAPHEKERDAVVARGGESSPHLGGRAQPGDVIGVETGGEQTHVGETTEDENKRRRDAEKEASEARKR